jgi:hypothetical protein
MLRAMHDSRRRFAVFGLCVLGCACASAPSAQPAAVPSRAPAVVASTPATPLDARALGPGATFADLVNATRVLIRGGHNDSSAGCLLARDPGGFMLRADLMPALDELPEVPLELDAQLPRTLGPARVLTAWGPAGRAEPEIVLTSFTSLPAESVHAPVVVLVLTDAGVYVRYGSAPVSDDGHALPIDTVIAHVLAAPGNADAVFYVSAEASVPLGTLAQLLHLLPADRSVALALVLPAGTKLPTAAAAPPAPSADMCADGLPELPESEAQGEIATNAIVGALEPLQAAARDCMDNANAAARAGGRLVLALRIARDGSVDRACTVKDAIGDAALTACVLSGARQLRFPQPSPSGSVDVQLPLSLAPLGPTAQRGMCEQ